MPKADDDQYSDDEAERRSREAIRRSFELPYKPHKELVGKTPRAPAPGGGRRLKVLQNLHDAPQPPQGAQPAVALY